MTNTNKFNFPVIQSIELTNFSLYTLQPNNNIDISQGVFCLAGANGLGKSTFLASINFALTGIVPDPERRFFSMEEYYRFGIDFSKDFFSGRINEMDRETASISIRFLVNNHIYHLTRGIFEPTELRKLEVIDQRTGTKIKQTELMSPPELQVEYQDFLTRDIGVNSFTQFVFLQHFIFTFDERRHLVLWDQRISTQALYLLLGTDVVKADTAEKLLREMERADSRARNYKYQESNVLGRINAIRNSVKDNVSSETIPEDLDDLRKQHKKLYEELSHYQEVSENKKHQIDDARLQTMEASSQLSSLQSEYSKVFSQRVLRRSNTILHPLISDTITYKKCAVCGNESEKAITNIEEKLNSDYCPLCDSKLEEIEDTENVFEQLQKLDQQIATSKVRLDEILKMRERLDRELNEIENYLNAITDQIKKFEVANDNILLQIRAKSQDSDITGIDIILERIEAEMVDLRQKSREEYKKRDQIREELLKLQRAVEEKYYEVETEFVPLFKNLAILFLGIDLDIRMNTNTSVTSPGMMLVVEIRGNVRREIYQLSESQRFFLDIALRMAFAQYISQDGSRASLFIDTPEGSLDIAYESRAGRMFAEFAKSGHSIIMTANINTSQLLLTLARDCGNEKMHLQKMTHWTELSEVQMEEEYLFEHAYDAIENALNSGS